MSAASSPATADDVAARVFTSAEKRATLFGVLIVFLLSALDQTIVSTAMPTIVTELKGLALYSWVTTSYLLASTVMVPVWGKLGDLYGRKPIMLWGIGLFLAGSWLAGLAGEFGDLPVLGGGMTQLIIFRAVQGLGGGALFTTAFAIIADLFPPRERGKFSGLFGAVFGVATAIGPLLGGWFTEHGSVTIGGLYVAGWRWVFYLNLPLGLMSLFAIIYKMPKLSHAARGKIDYIGAALIVTTFVPLLLALTFGGHSYAWTSPEVLGLLAVSVVSLVLFIYAEAKVPDPIVPLELFKNRVFTFANASGFLTSMAFLSAVSFLPLFMQIGQGQEASASGLSIMPLMAGLIATSVIAGRLVTRTGRYKLVLLSATAVLALGLFLLSLMDASTSRLDLAWRMFVLGVGLGPLQGIYALAMQNAAPPRQLGVVTSASQFFRQIGSTVGVAVFGTLLTNRLNGELGHLMPGLNLATLQEGAMMSATPRAAPPEVQVLIADAVTHVLGLGLIVVAVAFVCTLLIPELPLRDRTAAAPAKADEDGGVIQA